jgi:hypothetical protein
MGITAVDPVGAPRTLVRWQAQHDNGWTTIIAERADRRFAAWATTAQERSAVYIDTDIDHACAAVMASLYRMSGHRKCTAACHDWRLLEH